MSSLFPAYSKSSDSIGSSASDHNKTETEADWLKNTSFVYNDDEKVRRLNYDYLSCEQNKKGIEQETEHAKEEKPPKRVCMTGNDLVSGGLHDEQSSPPKKQKQELSISSSDSDENTSLHHKKKKKKKKKLKKHKHSHGKDHYTRDFNEGFAITECATKQDGKIFLEDFEQSQPNTCHYIDKSSDKANYTYQSIYKSHLPNYRCMKNASLGICIADIQGKFYNQKKKDSSYRYFQAKRKHGKEDSDDIPFTEPVLVNESSPLAWKEPPVLADFMALCESTEHSAKDVRLKDATSVLDEASTLSNPAFKKQELYNRKLTENPNNISLWLEFIAFQDQCSPTADAISLYETERGLKKQKKQEALILQTKEAIFERALKENPYSSDLKVAQLECFENYWDSEKLQAEWKELVMRNRHNVQVWQKYLNFAESKAASFTIASLIKAYKKCLLSLKSSVTDFVIGIFVRLCHRLKQSGHTEKATALFQAQLEYNMFAPANDMGLSASDLMEYFQAFWESGVPRFGEDNAQGWKHWIESQGNVPPFVSFLSQDEDEDLEQEILKKYGNKNDVWLAMEILRTSRHWLAWRPDGSTGYDDCEDLERLVVSDDVTFALFRVNTPLQSFKLLHLFLDFLGVPVKAHYNSIIRKIGLSDEDAPVKLETMSAIFQQQYVTSSILKLPHEKQLAYVKREKFIENIFTQTIPLFRTSEALHNSLILMYIDFLQQNVFSGLDKLSRKQQKARGKEMRSAMKKLLYEEPFRNSLLAWLRYALLEWYLGRKDDSRKALYHILTSLVSSESKSATKHSLYSVDYLLYRTYAEMEMGLIPPGSLIEGNTGSSSNSDNGRQKALQVLVSICSGDFKAPLEDFAITTSQIIKCKKYFVSVQNELVNSITEADLPPEEDCHVTTSLGSSLEHWTTCYAMFVYITAGLGAASEVFQELFESLDGALQKMEENKDQRCNLLDNIRQKLTESRISLLIFHLEQELVPLRTVRQPLLDAIQRYPSNANILWAYIMLELRSAFTGNLRRRLAKLCSNTKSSLVWTISLITQLHRLEKLKLLANETKALPIPEAQPVLPEVGYVNTVRSWFQWALSTNLCSHYLLLWRLYLQFEIQHGKPENVKRVFYEAVQHCPWAKCLYMDFIEAFPSCTQEVVDLMMERELRVRVPLEEIDILLENT